MQNSKKILVVQTAFIGDLVMSTPIFPALRKIFPDSQIDVLVIPSSAIILKHNPYINNILTFDKKKNIFRKITEIIRLLFYFQKNKYDIGIALQSSLTTAFMMLLGGVRTRVGNRHFWSTTNRVTIPKGLHIRQRTMQYLKPFSEEVFSDETEIFLDKAEIELAEQITSTARSNNQKIIVIAPGSVRFTKMWSTSKFENLAKKLAENNFKVFLIGSKAESQICNSIQNNVKHPNLENYCGKLNLLESAALIKMSDLLVCNDSAPLHLGNAVKTRVFAIFGPTVKQFGCYPYRDGDKLIEVDLECRPCSAHGGNSCPLGHHNCMNLINEDYVYNLIVNFI